MVELVVDASALVDLLLGNDLSEAVSERLRGAELHAPAHADADVLSALGRLNRAGLVSDVDVVANLTALAAASIRRHPVGPLLAGAWGRRHGARLADAVYLELAAALEVRLVTTDRRLHPHPEVDVVSGSAPAR